MGGKASGENGKSSLDHFGLQSRWIQEPTIFTPSVYHDIPLSPVLKIECGPLHADFGSIWSPQKARKFRYICNKRQKWVFCDRVNLTHYVFQYKFSFVVL